jgi:hypothetical protein
VLRQTNLDARRPIYRDWRHLGHEHEFTLKEGV